MRAFIRSCAAISPQLTHNTGRFPENIHETVSNRMVCLEPEYRDLINPLLLRRMPRILKMGLAAAQLAIKRANDVNPDGIIVGTGLGCLDNLEKFLMDVLDNNEHVTSVLPFINSTHNAVAAQISMMLKNQSYNITYCHRGFSFESALQDAMMLIHEDPSKNILAGGIDESTTDFILLHSYLNAWKAPLSNLKLITDNSAGTIAGEGSAFFILSGLPSHSESMVAVEGIHTFYSPLKSSFSEAEHEISAFLGNLHLSLQDVDGVLMGFNGDRNHDEVFYHLLNGIFAKQTVLYYKHLCGEYYTSSAFALWLGSVLSGQAPVPQSIMIRPGKSGSLKNLLIYNQINNTEHSLIFLNYGPF